VFCNAALKDWRVKQNFTKSQMAKLLNMSNSHYGYLENGVRQPSIKVITLLLEITRLPPEVFFPHNNMNTLEPIKLQARFLKSQQENLNLQKQVFAREIEIAKAGSVIHILEEIINVAVKAIQKKYNIDKYKDEVIKIAKNAIQINIPCDVVCNAFGINIYTLKKWIGQEKFLFKCHFDLFQPIYSFTPERAGEEFGCIDCIHLQNANCSGHGVSVNHTVSELDTELNVFNIVEDLVKKGITERSEQLKILEEKYNFRTTEATLSEYMRRHNKGEYVPDSFKLMTENY